MSHIFVNDAQAALIAASNGTLTVRDVEGHVIALLRPRPEAAENEARARLAPESQRPIVVDDEQAALISTSDGVLQVRDSQGGVIGQLTPWPLAVEIAKAKARLAAGHRGPTYTTAQVLEFLRALESQ